MADNIADVLRAVKEMLTKLIEPFRPVVRADEVYSQGQAMARLGVGQPVLKAWEARGLRRINRLNSEKIFYTGKDLLEFLERNATNV